MTFGMRTFNGSGHQYIDSLTDRRPMFSGMTYHSNNSVGRVALSNPGFTDSFSFSTNATNAEIDIQTGASSHGSYGATTGWTDPFSYTFRLPPLGRASDIVNPRAHGIHKYFPALFGGASNSALAKSVDNTSYVLPNTSYPIYRFGYRSALAAHDSYGLFTSNIFGENTVDETYRALYYQPLTTTNLYHTATAHTASDQVEITLSNGTVTTQYDFSGGLSARSSRRMRFSPGMGGTQNITFPMAYREPPLIFLVWASRGVALRRFFTNALGQYVGAEIVVGRDWWQAENRSAAITYFLVSPEIPHYISEPVDYGVYVFNANGDRVFDSRYPAGPIGRYAGYAFPGYVPKAGTSDSSYTTDRLGGGAITINDRAMGVLLNSQPFMAGLLIGHDWAVGITTPTGSHTSNMRYQLQVWGHYLRVSPVGDTQKTISLECLTSFGGREWRGWANHQNSIRGLVGAMSIGFYGAPTASANWPPSSDNRVDIINCSGSHFRVIS